MPTPSSIGGATAAEKAAEPESEEESEEEEEELLAEEEAQEEEDLNFAAEVSDTVKRAVSAGHSVDNVALEVNSLKFAQNRSFGDCVLAILPALLETLELAELPSKPKRVKAVEKCLGRWGALLSRFVQSATEQDVLMTALERHCEADAVTREIFEHVTKQLYECDDDILDEEAIERWAAAAADEDDGSHAAKLLKQSEAMLTWLREADDEDSDEDDE